jgi:bacteriocin-like protein
MNTATLKKNDLENRFRELTANEMAEVQGGWLAELISSIKAEPYLKINMTNVYLSS